VFSDRRYQEIAGILIIVFTIILLLSLTSFSLNDFEQLTYNKPVKNLIGPFGAWLANFFRTAFGYSSLIFCVILGFSGYSVLKKGGVGQDMERIFSLSFLVLTTSAMLALVLSTSLPQFSGGFIGLYIHKFLDRCMGGVGATLVIILMNLTGFILLGALSINALIHSARIPDSSGLKARLGALAGFFARGHTAPLNSIDEDLANSNKKARKPPWITRKRVTIYNGRIQDDDKDRHSYALNLLEFKNSLLKESFSTGESDEVSHSMVVSLDDSGDRDEQDLTATPGTETDLHEGARECDAEGFIDDDAQFPEGETAKIKTSRFSIADADEPVMDAVRRDDSVMPSSIQDPEPGSERQHRVMREPSSKSTTAKGTAPGEVQQTFDFGGFDAGLLPDEKVFEEISINHEYIVPTAFLQSSSMSDGESWRSEILKNSELLVNTLRDFGIESRVINVNRGPVITLYEMQIAPGIKVNRIVSLSDDIALALAGSRVRIVAPIPGKSAIGVEVPNSRREMVALGDVIGSREFQGSSGHLKVALGKDILGKPVMLDLKKLPHLLIAGATGSGKSVCVNSIITSLVYSYDPNFVRFIMVDPKMVELQLYNGIPHLLTPVIVDATVAPKALKWAMYEMERRYRLLSQLNTRDIERYNQKVSGYGAQYEKLPYIVIIMDELADLMMVASKEIEGYITRIAQKARAVGIHLVLATQRPSVDVITGVIKANFPARIAFQVAQKTDSRTIIDQNGAEKLLGKGDMLYQSPMSSFPMRLQGAFISEDEIQNIVTHLRSMGNPNYIDIDESIFEEELADEEGGDDDALFVEALKIVEETKKASASYLQRRLSIGYNRAARIIELMEERGYIGAQQGSKPREVFI